MPPTAPASSSVSEAIEIEPLLVVAPDTLRAAKFAPSPVRSTVPLLTKDFAVTESDDERRVADIQRAGVGQRPADRQGRAAVGAAVVEIDGSAIGERAGRRHRGAVLEIEGARDVGEPGQSAVRARAPCCPR